MVTTAFTCKARGRLLACLFTTLASAAVLLGCGGGGNDAASDPPVSAAGDAFLWTAPGTAELDAIDPGLPPGSSLPEAQAFLAFDGRAALRVQVRGAQSEDLFEQIYTRASDGVWQTGDRLPPPNQPETWDGNWSGWLRTTTPTDGSTGTGGPADSVAIQIAPGVGRALREAPRHREPAGQFRLGSVLDDDGSVFLIDFLVAGANDPGWTVWSTRVPANAQVAPPVALLRHTSRFGVSRTGRSWNNRPKLSHSPTGTSAAISWAEAPGAGDEPVSYLARTRVRDTSTDVAQAVGAEDQLPCSRNTVHTLPWATLSFWTSASDDAATCLLHVRVAETRLPGTTSVTDAVLALPGFGYTSRHWVAAGPDGELMALWTQNTTNNVHTVLATATGRVPPGDQPSRAWSWSEPTLFTDPNGSPSFRLGLDGSHVRQGRGGHVAVVFQTQAITTHPAYTHTLWIRRYSPGAGWETTRKLATSRSGFLLGEKGIDVAPDGKVLVTYVGWPACSGTTCATRLVYPRAIVID